MSARRAIAMSLAALAALLMLAVLPTPAAALDDGKPGPGQLWAPGQILVRFYNHVGAAERDRIAKAAGVKLVYKVPLVRNLWEVVTTGKVRSTELRLNGQRGVEYSQPNYIDTDQLDSAPTENGYWPDDPYFWPQALADPNRCLEPGQPPGFQSQLGGWGLWPSGLNLTDPGVLDPNVNLPAATARTTVAGGQPEFASYWGIDVLPVWNLLLDEGRLWNGVRGAGERGTPRNGPWRTEQIHEYGVGVMDTGISNHPDVAGQLAALFSVVQSREKEFNNQRPVLRTRIREVYADDHDRALHHDIEAVERVIPGGPQTLVQPLLRPLFALDDAGVLDSRDWEPGGNHQPALPIGCDGHGTAVASVAGARANNGQGVAGVGYDVPLVGLRTGEVWDMPGDRSANNNGLDQEIEQWLNWRDGVQANSDLMVIMQYAVAKALELPVLNMSFSKQMLKEGQDSTGHKRLLVLDPAIIEAEADLFTTGKTLGVAAAGNHREGYGRGPGAVGAVFTRRPKGEPQAIHQPCGLPLIPKLGVWKTADGGQLAEGPYTPDVNWSKLEFICVGATTSSNSQLANFSGQGSAGVQLAAPGHKISVATRPAGSAPNEATYKNSSGTSEAAPMVSGAAALLRRAAPGADIDDIRRALEQGARMNAGLIGKVRYGELDVACSLRWLLARSVPNWHLIGLAGIQQRDPNGYQDLLKATTGCGNRAGQPGYLTTETLSVAKDALFANKARFGTMQEFIGSFNFVDSPTTNSRRWQDVFTQDPRFAGQHALFSFFRGGGPTLPVARPVYKPEQTLTIGCTKPGYRVTGLGFEFTTPAEPSGAWWLPTDNVGPFKRITVAIAVAKPWYAFLMPKEIRIRAVARCQFFAYEG